MAANLAQQEARTDEALVTAFREGENNAQDILIDRYKQLVKLSAREYFMIGADSEDIIQEGMIGLYKAIRDYDNMRNVPFYCFAQLCITRQIMSAIKAASRKKHMPLNAYISLNNTVYSEEHEKPYIETLSESRITNPEELFIGKEGKDYLEANVSALLSEMECRVLSLHLRGKSYSRIAEIISRDEKSVDNALQRVRRKIEKFLRAGLMN